MSQQKLEYLLENLPSKTVKRFARDLEKSTRQREKMLAATLRLIRRGTVESAEIYRQIYPKKPFSEKHIRNLRSDLVQRLIDAVTLDALRDSDEWELYRYRALRQLGVNKYLPNLEAKAERKLARQPVSLERLELADLWARERITAQLQREGRRAITYAHYVAGLEATFAAKRLYSALGQQERNRIIDGRSARPDSALLALLQREIQAGKWSDSPLIQTCSALLDQRGDPTPAQRARVKAHLTQYAATFARPLAYSLYLVAINHCTRAANAGATGALREMHHFFREMLAKGIFSDYQYLDPILFNTMVKVGLRTGEYAWTEHLIVDHAAHLPPEQAAVFQAHSLGLLAYAQGDWGTAEPHFNRAIHLNQDPFLGLDIRSYLLRIYYETGDDIGAESLVHSFRLYLYRYQHLAPPRLRIYQEFVRLYRRLITLTPDHPAQLAELREAVVQSPMNVARHWFLEKIAALAHGKDRSRT
ncbi:MAG: hypothetical protein AAGN35_22900 [Bacteroidota bacterium]